MRENIKRAIKKALTVCTLILSIVVVFSIVDENPTFADSGFGTSYSGGGSSYSGGSSHSSSSYSSSYSSGSSYNGDSTNEGEAVIVIIIFFVIFILVLISISKDKSKNNYHDILVDETEIEQKIKQYIPNFNKEEFLQNGYNIYEKVQDAWMNFKLEDVRDQITDELYNMYESQLATLEVKGEQNIMKDFVLKNSFLKDVTMQNNTITISTGYIIEFYDYIIEQSTGKVVRGTSNRKVRITYEMKFRQTLDETKKVTKCPNCGAEIDMNTTGVCDYCHTKLVTENTKWVLTEKQTLYQENL